MNILKNVGSALSKKAPEILTGVAVTGVVSTAIFAVKATPDALWIINDLEKEQDRSLTKQEVVKATWQCYIPAMICGGITIASIIAATSIGNSRQAALAAVGSLAQDALKDYQEKTKEKIGEKKENEIREEIAEDKMRKTPLVEEQVILTGHGLHLCYDALCGRYFRSDAEKIRQQANTFNREMLNDGWSSVNAWYYEMGLDPVGLGEDVGWTVEHLMDLHISARVAENGEPCLVIDHHVKPTFENLYGYKPHAYL